MRLYDVHHFILQLEKGVSSDDCVVALDEFMSHIIDHHVYNSPTNLEYLFVKKPLLLDHLTSKIKHMQTNNHIFLVISE